VSARITVFAATIGCLSLYHTRNVTSVIKSVFELVQTARQSPRSRLVVSVQHLDAPERCRSESPRERIVHQRQSEERSNAAKVWNEQNISQLFGCARFAVVLAACLLCELCAHGAGGWWRAHTYQVLLETQALLTSLIDMETGVRGYVNTRNEQFLEPYTRGKTQFDVHWQEALRSTADNPVQQERLRALKAQQRTWFRHQQVLLNVRRTTA
jgi:hypothetical protein